MKVGSLCIFSITTVVMLGVWQFVYLWIIKRGYALFGQPGESRFDFCCRELGSPLWRLRRWFGMARFYNGRLFVGYMVFRGVVFLLLGIAGVVGYIWVRSTAYGAWLDIIL